MRHSVTARGTLPKNTREGNFGGKRRARPRYLGPGSRPPVRGAGQAVAGPARVGPLAAAVFAVHGAVGGGVARRLDAAHRAHLEAQAAAGARAVLPLLRHPPAGKKGRAERAADATRRMLRRMTCTWTTAATRALLLLPMLTR